MIRTSTDIFKNNVFKVEVLNRIQMMIGEQVYKSGKSNIQPNDELTMGGSRLNEGLMSMQLMYIGGIIESSQIAGMRRLIIRATRC
jgi:hypothetical protein